MASLDYWLWLSSAGLSPRAKAALLARYGDAEAAFFAPAGEYALIPGISKSEAAVLERRDLRPAAEVRDACEEQGLRILTLQDADYPRRLKQLWSPPVALYVKGRLPAVDDCAPIAVIGTRHNSLYGLRMAAALTTELVQGGGVIVTPLTSAIEQESTRAALRAGGRCIGVLGVPHERETRPIAADLAAHGALVSEYPPYTRPLPVFFRDRNRIAAGLSVGVLVIEATEKSGTGLFVAEAAEQGKEIFAVPGNLDAIGSAGTLAMLRDGAHLATCGWDVLREFEPLFPRQLRRTLRLDRLAAPEPAFKTEEETPPPPEPAKPTLRKQLEGLNETQLRLIAALDEKEKHIDDIIEATGLPTATVLSQLTLLQIKGYIRALPGRRFTLKVETR